MKISIPGYSEQLDHSTSVRPEAVLQGIHTVKWPLSTCMAGESLLGVNWPKPMNRNLGGYKSLTSPAVKRVDCPKGHTTEVVNL